MLINNEHSDNMPRHGSVKPVCCWFLCILIDPSLLFNMTAASRAVIRPHLRYLLFWCTLWQYHAILYLWSDSPRGLPDTSAVCLRLRRFLRGHEDQSRELLFTGDFKKIWTAQSLHLLLCILISANEDRVGWRCKRKVWIKSGQILDGYYGRAALLP